jgi:hypothetical protein
VHCVLMEKLVAVSVYQGESTICLPVM